MNHIPNWVLLERKNLACITQENNILIGYCEAKGKTNKQMNNNKKNPEQKHCTPVGKYVSDKVMD